MLVMSRRPGERIVIDNSIVVTILRTARGRVRLGIDAPAGVTIRRDELLKAATNEEAVQTGLACVVAAPPGPAE
jgi:carbon storage regulator